MRAKQHLFLAASLMALVGLGLALEGAGTTSNTANQSAQTSSAQSTTIEAGNVSQVDVSSDSLTDKWSGFYGNISAQKVLGDGANNFYTWTASTFSDAKVVAVPSGDATPSTINPVSNPDSFLGGEYSSGTASAGNTFTLTKDTRLSGDWANDTSSVNTYNGSEISDEDFTTYLTENGASTGQPVYIGEGTSETGFNDNAINYQLLVGVGETATEKKFDFYLEIS